MSSLISYKILGGRTQQTPGERTTRRIITKQKEKLDVVSPMVEFQPVSLSSELDGGEDLVGGWDVGP